MHCRPSIFSTCNVENVGVSWGRGYILTTFLLYYSLEQLCWNFNQHIFLMCWYAKIPIIVVSSPIIIINCLGNQLDDISSCLNMTSKKSDISRTCAEGFFLENNSHTGITCTPLCGFWITAAEITEAENVIFVISISVAVISCGILFIVALWLQRDTM